MNPRQAMRPFSPTKLLAEHDIAYRRDMSVEELQSQARNCAAAAARVHVTLQGLHTKINAAKQRAKEGGDFAQGQWWVDMNNRVGVLGFQHQHLQRALGEINRLIKSKTRSNGRRVLDMAFIDVTSERYGTRALDELWEAAKGRAADPEHKSRYLAQGATE